MMSGDEKMLLGEQAYTKKRTADVVAVMANLLVQTTIMNQMMMSQMTLALLSARGNGEGT
jgi:hypothetical protein